MENNFLQKYLNLFDIPCLPLSQMFEEALKYLAFEGLWLECGVFKGESAIEILKYAKDSNKILYGFDSLLGLEEDLTPINKKGVCSPKSIPKYPSNIKFIHGKVQDTLILFLQEHKNEIISFINLDMTYTPIFYVIDTLLKNKKLKIGSIITIQQAIRPEEEKIYDGNYRGVMEALNKYNICFKYLATSDVHVAIQLT